MVCSEIFDNHAGLERLEQVGADLASGYRSRETAAVRSKLATLRRAWESLCAQAKDRYVEYLCVHRPRIGMCDMCVIRPRIGTQDMCAEANDRCV